MIIGGNNGTDPIMYYEYFDIGNLKWANLAVESQIPPTPMNSITGFLILRFDEDGCEAIIFSMTWLTSIICT